MGKRKWNSGFSGHFLLNRKTDTEETGIRREVPARFCYTYHSEKKCSKELDITSLFQVEWGSELHRGWQKVSGRISPFFTLSYS